VRRAHRHPAAWTPIASGVLRMGADTAVW
jgi:hypothetical protein